MGMKKTARTSREAEEDRPEAMEPDGTAAAAIGGDDDDNATNDDDDDNSQPVAKESKRKSKKRSKKPSHDDDDDEEADTAKVKQTKEERKLAKAAVRASLPQIDPDTSLPFTKTQIRRMKRRVKHGLHPIATEEEENEIRRREKRERVEEEKLYANEDADADTAEGAAIDDAEGTAVGDDGNAEKEAKREDNPTDQASTTNQADYSEPPPPRKKKRHNPPSLNTKRTKPVPEGYVCFACKNQPSSEFDTTFKLHWIYDCPLKQTKKGCNQLAKGLRGLHDPPENKIFVSGLPFDCDEGSVKRFFEETLGDGSRADGGGEAVASELMHVKLLKFEDSKRCKGTGFLTFDSEDGAKLAIRVMNGSVWKEVEEPGTSSKKQKKGGKKQDAGGAGEDRKELKLRVTKVLNRFVTKQRKGGSKPRNSWG